MLENHDLCPHCGPQAPIARPSRAWRIAVPVAWLSTAGMVLATSMLGFGLVMLAPVVFAFGALLIGGVHARAGEPPTCQRCGKITSLPPVLRQPAAELAQAA